MKTNPDRAMSWCSFHRTVHATDEFWMQGDRPQKYCRAAFREYDERVRRERAARWLIRELCT